jgi:hypothetical protein
MYIQRDLPYVFWTPDSRWYIHRFSDRLSKSKTRIQTCSRDAYPPYLAIQPPGHNSELPEFGCPTVERTIRSLIERTPFAPAFCRERTRATKRVGFEPWKTQPA